MPTADNENCLGNDCTGCNQSGFTMTITEAGTGDIEAESGDDSLSIQAENGKYLRTE